LHKSRKKGNGIGHFPGCPKTEKASLREAYIAIWKTFLKVESEMETGKWPSISWYVIWMDGRYPIDSGETTSSVPVSRLGTWLLSFRTIPKQTLGSKSLLKGSYSSALWLVIGM
jgi:hypothetical protein